MKNDKVFCSECDKVVNKRNTCIIDEKPVCFFCIYGGTKPFEIYPIGKARTDLKPHETDGFSSDSKGISCIDLLPSQKRFMYKLDEEAFLTVVYYLHNVKSVKTVFKRGLDGKRVGVFASRTPNRPSKIGIQDVRLLKIKGTTLYVEGLDAMEGSPVLDIKLKLSTLDFPPKI